MITRFTFGVGEVWFEGFGKNENSSPGVLGQLARAIYQFDP